MNRKNILTIVVAVIIIVVAGGLVYRFFAPPTKDTSVQVTVPRPVVPTFDQEQLNQLSNPKYKDYTPDITPNFGDRPTVF